MRIVSFLTVLCVGVAGLVAAGAAPAAADNRPVVSQVRTVDAPKDEKGGVLSAYAGCENYRARSRARWVLTNLETKTSDTYRWRGGGPGMEFPRVPVGEYRSRTTAWCRGERTTRTEVVEIEQKTAKGTVSRAEWKRVKRGMTRARVRQVLHTDGRDPWRYKKITGRTYDMMAFWRWSVIEFREGRVLRKHWDVGHD